jgi:hypothetical protein
VTPDRRTILPLTALGLAVLLAGCQSENKTKASGPAGGQILPGSTSDAMLPVDSLRSQPPLAPKATGSATASESKRGDNPSPKSDEQPPEASPTPESTQAPVTEE